MTRLSVNLLLVLLTLGGAGLATAQVDVQVRLEKRVLLGGEPVQAVVTITNRAGRDLSFSGSESLSWLDFVVKDSRDQPVAMLGRPMFAAVSIGAGQSVARRMELSRLFRLSELGNYAVTAVVREADNPRDAYLSNRETFNVTTGRVLWSQKVGTGKRGELREYRLVSFNVGQRSEIYVQIADARLNQALSTFSLGEVLMFRQPQVAVDGQRQMHVMHLLTPTLWVHTSISPDGVVLGREMFLRGGGDPQMVTLANGSVTVQGGILHDPQAQREAAGRIRNLSERPN
jgi:hypothetical protein